MKYDKSLINLDNMYIPPNLKVDVKGIPIKMIYCGQSCGTTYPESNFDKELCEGEYGNYFIEYTCKHCGCLGEDEISNAELLSRKSINEVVEDFLLGMGLINDSILKACELLDKHNESWNDDLTLEDFFLQQ